MVVKTFPALRVEKKIPLWEERGIGLMECQTSPGAKCASMWYDTYELEIFPCTCGPNQVLELA